MNTVQKSTRPESVNVPVVDRTNWKRRLVVVLPLAVLLLGPTPGAIGSCNQDAEDNPVLNTTNQLIEYCQQKEQLICYRRELRGELDKDESTECRHQAIRLCETRFWSPDCRPTKRRAEACLRALSSKDTLDTEESEIEECRTSELCTDVRIKGPEPSDLDAKIKGPEPSDLDAKIEGSEPSDLDAGDAS